MTLFQVDGTDDGSDYLELISAMTTMGMGPEEQSEVLQVVSAVLHLGNVLFREEGSEKAVVDSEQREC